MNRPLFFKPFSLFRRCFVVQFLSCLLIINSVVTVSSSQLQGCSLDNNLCDNDEICLPDGLFGQCYSESTNLAPLIVQKPLNQIQKEVLKVQLMRLASENYNWPDPQSQCVLAYFKLAVVYDLEYDPEFCVVRNPTNIWTLVQKVQNILSDQDGILTDGEFMIGQNEARNLIQNVDETMPNEGYEAIVEMPDEQVSSLVVAEPALLVDSESQMALPVVVVDELNQEPIMEQLPVENVIAVETPALTVNPQDKNNSSKLMTEANMGNPNNDVQKIVTEILQENQLEADKRSQQTVNLSSTEEKQLNDYVHDIMNNRETNVKKLSEQQVDKLADLIGSLQDAIIQSQFQEEISDPEIEENIPLTSLSNEQQLLLKKDLERYNNEDMGLANTVHKIVKGDFQRVEGNRVYLKMSKDEVTEDELVKLIEYLDSKIALPNNMFFDDFKYENGELSFRVVQFDSFKKNGEKRMTSASGVAQAVYKRRKDIQTLSGVQVAETGIGSGEDAVPVERSDRDWLFTPILAICAFTITTLVVVLAVHFIKNRRRLIKSNLPEVIDSLEGGKSVAAYEDLCRQRMSSQDTPTGVTVNAATVSKTSSTSSWPDESVIQSSKLDISTGHVILSFLKEHLENPDKIEEQWNSVSGYFNKNAISTIALEPQNITKNRDRNVIPYDENVVTTENGYINASKIFDSDPKHCSYIVTQAPMESTIPAYWEMIWEQGVALLVNLCEMDECEKYWPDEGSQVYGSFEVNLVSEHIWSENYVVRSFYLKSLKTNETRTVTQFHFLSWKKNQVPASNKSLLEFRRKVNKSYRGRASPVLVHDLNGAGRAGTYCLIDLVITRIGKGVKEIDMAASLEHLRDQRPFLVANSEQYKMVFSSVAEEVTSMIKLIQH
uniref:Receptor-type tyrosine-protein phosphatase N2 n=1 Tax=Panagrolaimus sp. JU765 TaxID=591449 RepID=A0AC34RF79_9BILA